MEEVIVSIIVCCYNQEKYIEQTLDSILSQVHTYPYEVIVCDDASKDLTPNIVAIYAEKHREVVPVLRENNLGIVKNFYDAISRCKGKYIMVCGGDDYFLPGKISKQIDFMECHHNIGLIHSDVQLISQEGHPKRIKNSSEHSSVEHLLSHYNINAPTMTFRKYDLDKYINEIKPIEKDWLMEDLPISLWFKIKHKMTYFPGVFVAYRIVNNSISHQISDEGKFIFERSCFEVSKYFQCEYPDTISINAIIHRHLDIVLSLNHYGKFRDYCEKHLLNYDKFNNKMDYMILKARIYNNTFNKFVVFIKANIKRSLIIKQEFIRAIR